MNKIIAAILVGALFGLPAADATVLTFDSASGFEDEYGDRAPGPVDGAFTYGADHGPTPNVTVQYLDDDESWFQILASGASDLENALVLNSESEQTEGYTICLRADAGYFVALYGFDIGTEIPGYTTSEIAAANVRGDVVLGGEDISVPAAGLSMGNAFPIVSREIKIRVGYYTPELDGFPIGIDNIAFGQIQRLGRQRAQLKTGAIEESSWSEVKGLFR
ncbi:MAG: hypothetical protein HKN20_15810 [Gemmatimonadetes bacterium]|nr:hypothetical protein [Gemmatimonadota bacterium]